MAQKFAPLRGKRVGLVTHPAAVDAQLRTAVDLFATADGVKLVTIFGPEHGLHGQAQDLIAGKLAINMNAEKLAGVTFRPAWFRPTFQKHAGKDCGGVQLHVTDRSVFQPVRTSLALLATMREMSGDSFAWRTEVYEFVSKPIAIDLLFGSDRERNKIEVGQPWREIAAAWEPEERAFDHRRHAAWMYE